MKAILVSLLFGICSGLSLFFYDKPWEDINFQDKPSEIIYWNEAPPYWQ